MYFSFAVGKTFLLMSFPLDDGPRYQGIYDVNYPDDRVVGHLIRIGNTGIALRYRADTPVEEAKENGWI